MPAQRLASLPWSTAASVLLVGAALLVLAAPAHAQWKWKDARGQVHVSDLPPPRDVPERNILQRPTAATRTVVTAPVPAAAASAPASAALPARPPADPELDKRRKAAEQEQQAKAKADEERLAAQKRENCARARSHLATLDSGIRIARTNEKGEREILDDKARADEVRRTREVIAADCR